jgi:hypothetical protein
MLYNEPGVLQIHKYLQLAILKVLIRQSPDDGHSRQNEIP